LRGQGGIEATAGTLVEAAGNMATMGGVSEYQLYKQFERGEIGLDELTRMMDEIRGGAVVGLIALTSARTSVNYECPAEPLLPTPRETLRGNGGARLFPGSVDDVIASASRPSRVGSTTSRAVQALQKKITNAGKAANFGGLKANESTANALIREAFGARNPVFRTSMNRAGQPVIDILNPSTGRGVRLLRESGAFDTFVNY
jgi:hypothetical protein